MRMLGVVSFTVFAMGCGVEGCPGGIAEIGGNAKVPGASGSLRSPEQDACLGLLFRTITMVTGRDSKRVLVAVGFKPAGIRRKFQKKCATCKRDIDRSRKAKIYAALHLGA